MLGRMNVAAENPAEAQERLFDAARAAQDLGDDARAEGLYRELTARHPEHAPAHCNLANLLLRQGRAAEAETCYRAAIDADPFLALAHANLGQLHFLAARPAEAARHYREAVDIDPDCIAGWNGLGAALHRLGDGPGAAAAFAQAAVRAPGEADAHRNLGLLALAAGNHADALRHLQEARRHTPEDVELMAQEARALIGLGRSAEAHRMVDAALAVRPDEPWLHMQKGGLLSEAGRPADAVPHLERAAAAFPAVPELHNNLALALQASGRLEAAEAALHRALALDPDFPEAWNNLGSIHSTHRRQADALAAFERALALKPDFAMAACNRGNALRALGRLGEARAAFAAALAMDGRLPNAHNGLALLLQQENRHEQAVAAFRAALALQEDYVEALNNLAISLTELGRTAEAAQTYQRLLSIRPDLPEALFNLGTLLQQLGLYDASIAAFAEMIRQRPEARIAYPYLAHSMMQQCRWDNLAAVVESIRRNAEAELAAGLPVSISPFALQSLPGEIPMDLRRRVADRAARHYAAAVLSEGERPRLPHRPVGPRRRLRIGYVSPDFRAHSVAVAFRSVLEHHARDDFELYGYYVSPQEADDMTRWFAERFDVFRPLARLAFDAAARQIAEDGIDILIDLAGHTRRTRLELFALRPAPLQAHWLGYSATVGGGLLDYLITDRWQVPPEARPHFGERLVYLPETFMATQRAPIADVAVTRADQGLPQDGFVFANFNALYKFDPRMFDVWMRLLRQVPVSVLWAMRGTDGTVENLRREAAARGVDPARLVFAGRAVHPAHLARLRLADLALDNLWHGGGVTTVDALWAGLPVLTVTGATPQSRNGASLLGAIGLDDLIAPDLAAYERLALALAREPARLAEVRRRLAANRDSEPLFRPKRLTRHLEAGYRLMWQARLDGDLPAVIEVPRLA